VRHLLHSPHSKSQRARFLLHLEVPVPFAAELAR